MQSVDELEKQGFEVIRLMPDKQGRITEQQVFDAVNSDTILVSMMYVNNEVGSIMPVKSIKKAVKRANAPALIHIDCVQAFGKLEVKPSKLGADLVTVTRILPRVFGGEQEKKLRPGTEAIPLIAGFGVAADLIPDLKKQSEKIKEINTYAKEGLLSVPGVKINSGDDASDYIINLFVPTFMTSQTVVQHLSSKYGVYVSNGSACAKGKRSHVLTAMKLDDKIIEKSIRVSFSRTTTKGDIDEFVNAIKETVVQYPM